MVQYQDNAREEEAKATLPPLGIYLLLQRHYPWARASLLSVSIEWDLSHYPSCRRYRETCEPCLKSLMPWLSIEFTRILFLDPQVLRLHAVCWPLLGALSSCSLPGELDDQSITFDGESLASTLLDYGLSFVCWAESDKSSSFGHALFIEQDVDLAHIKLEWLECTSQIVSVGAVVEVSNVDSGAFGTQ